MSRSKFEQDSEKKIVPKFFESHGTSRIIIWDYNDEKGRSMQRRGIDYSRWDEKGREIRGSVKGHKIELDYRDGKTPNTEIVLRMGQTKGVPIIGGEYLENLEEDLVWKEEYPSNDMSAIIHSEADEMFLTNRNLLEDRIRGVFIVPSRDISKYITWNKVPSSQLDWNISKSGKKEPKIKEEYVPYIKAAIKKNIAGAFKAGLSEGWSGGKVSRKNIKGHWYTPRECWEKFKFCEGSFTLPNVTNAKGGIIKITWSIYKNRNENNNASYCFRLWWADSEHFIPFEDSFCEGL